MNLGAAQLGAVDDGARTVIIGNSYGPGYDIPGLPHRTGHGCGLDIHEWPYLVRGTQTPLATGMVFSNEPMLVIPRKFGIRLEDHFIWASKARYGLLSYHIHLMIHLA